MGLLTFQEANASHAPDLSSSKSLTQVTKYEGMGLKLKGQMDVHSPWGDFTFYSMGRDTEGE